MAEADAPLDMEYAETEEEWNERIDLENDELVGDQNEDDSGIIVANVSEDNIDAEGEQENLSEESNDEKEDFEEESDMDLEGDDNEEDEGYTEEDNDESSSESDDHEHSQDKMKLVDNGEADDNKERKSHDTRKAKRNKRKGKRKDLDPETLETIEILKLEIFSGLDAKKQALEEQKREKYLKKEALVVEYLDRRKELNYETKRHSYLEDHIRRFLARKEYIKLKFEEKRLGISKKKGRSKKREKSEKNKGKVLTTKEKEKEAKKNAKDKTTKVGKMKKKKRDSIDWDRETEENNRIKKRKKDQQRRKTEINLKNRIRSRSQAPVKVKGKGHRKQSKIVLVQTRMNDGDSAIRNEGDYEEDQFPDAVNRKSSRGTETRSKRNAPKIGSSGQVGDDQEPSNKPKKYFHTPYEQACYRKKKAVGRLIHVLLRQRGTSEKKKEKRLATIAKIAEIEVHFEFRHAEEKIRETKIRKRIVAQGKIELALDEALTEKEIRLRGFTKKASDLFRHRVQYDQVIRKMVDLTVSRIAHDKEHLDKMKQLQSKKIYWKEKDAHDWQGLMELLRTYSERAYDSKTLKRIPWAETEGFCQEILKIQKQMCEESLKKYKRKRGLELSLRRLEEYKSQSGGDGFQILEYEQLRGECRTLEIKLRDKDDDIEVLKNKVEHVVQILSHFREKIRRVENLIARDKETFVDLTKKVYANRSSLARIMMEFDNVRKEEKILKVESGILENTRLLKDFEKTHFDILHLKETKRKIEGQFRTSQRELASVKEKMHTMRLQIDQISHSVGQALKEAEIQIYRDKLLFLSKNSGIHKRQPQKNYN